VLEHVTTLHLHFTFSALPCAHITQSVLHQVFSCCHSFSLSYSLTLPCQDQYHFLLHLLSHSHSVKLYPRALAISHLYTTHVHSYLARNSIFRSPLQARPKDPQNVLTSKRFHFCLTNMSYNYIDLFAIPCCTQGLESLSSSFTACKLSTSTMIKSCDPSGGSRSSLQDFSPENYDGERTKLDVMAGSQHNHSTWLLFWALS
jgi:hypothetical protein